MIHYMKVDLTALNYIYSIQVPPSSKGNCDWGEVEKKKKKVAVNDLSSSASS